MNSNEGELIEQDGKRYSRISAEKAFRIRFDVQLYYYCRPEQSIRRDYDTPGSYRRAFSEDPQEPAQGKDSETSDSEQDDDEQWLTPGM